MATSLGSSKTPIARKDHICDYCRQKIIKGEKYQSSGIVSDGSAYTWKNHIHCQNIAEHFKMFDKWTNELTGEEFREYVWCIYQDSHKDEKWDWKNFPKMIDFCIELMNKQKQLRNETKS